MALVIDVGQLYVERGELQSGADAASLAVAKACATNTPDCQDLAAVTALAQRYLNANASDGVSKLDVLCGRLPFDEIDCPAPNTNLTACLGSTPTFGNYVEVRMVTEMADGRLVLPPTFAQAVFEDFDGAAVGACGRAGWQLRIDVPLLGIAMSTCDFADARIGDEVVIGDASPCRPADRRGPCWTTPTRCARCRCPTTPTSAATRSPTSGSRRPEFVNSSVWSPAGTRLALGTTVWPRSAKNSRKRRRISADGSRRDPRIAGDGWGRHRPQWYRTAPGPALSRLRNPGRAVRVMRRERSSVRVGACPIEAQGDVMAFVRKCEQCGHIDDREQWSSAAEAADQGAFQNWTCPTCAWTEFDLVEEAEAARRTRPRRLADRAAALTARRRSSRSQATLRSRPAASPVTIRARS